MEGPLHPRFSDPPFQGTTLQRAPELARQVVLRASRVTTAAMSGRSYLLLCPRGVP